MLCGCVNVTNVFTFGTNKRTKQPNASVSSKESTKRSHASMSSKDKETMQENTKNIVQSGRKKKKQKPLGLKMAQSTKRSRESPESSSSSTTTTTSSNSKHCRVVGPRSSVKKLCTIGKDVSCHLMTFLENNALKIVVFLSRSMRDTVHSYFAVLLQKSTFHISTVEMIKGSDGLFHRDFPNLNNAMEMLQILSTLPGYASSKKVELELEAGVHEVVGGCLIPGWDPSQKTLSVPCNNLSWLFYRREQQKGSRRRSYHEESKWFWSGCIRGTDEDNPGEGDSGKLSEQRSDCDWWCQARRDGLSISSEWMEWGGRAWIQDDHPSHQLHFSSQQGCWCVCRIWCCGGSDGRRNVRA